MHAYTHTEAETHTEVYLFLHIHTNIERTLADPQVGAGSKLIQDDQAGVHVAELEHLFVCVCVLVVERRDAMGSETKEKKIVTRIRGCRAILRVMWKDGRTHSPAAARCSEGRRRGGRSPTTQTAPGACFRSEMRAAGRGSGGCCMGEGVRVDVGVSGRSGGNGSRCKYW